MLPLPSSSPYLPEQLAQVSGWVLVEGRLGTEPFLRSSLGAERDGWVSYGGLPPPPQSKPNEESGDSQQPSQPSQQPSVQAAIPQTQLMLAGGQITGVSFH